MHPHPRSTVLLSLLLSSPFFQSAPKEDTKNSDDAPRGLKLREKGTFDGYTLFSPILSNRTFLIDMDGRVVHEWKCDAAPGNSDYFLADGHLLRTKRIEEAPVFHGGGIGGGVQELDWDGKVVWEWTLATEAQHHHHDIRPMPNGHFLAIVWERFTRDEAIARGRDPEQVGDEGLWPDSVLEMEPLRPRGAKVVWEWHVKDHVVQDRDPKKPAYGKLADHPELVDINSGRRLPPQESAEERKKREEQEARMRGLGYAGGAEDAPDPKKKPGAKGAPPDAPSGAPPGASPGATPDVSTDAPPRKPEPDWLHMNSVDYDAEHDLVMISSPRLSEIFVIDHGTTTAEAAAHSGGRRGHGGDLLWRYGNPKNYGAGGDADRRLFGQHDARWIRSGRPGAGHVTVFNNGEGRPGGDGSSVDELVLPFDQKTGFARAKGQPFQPAEIAWTYSAKDSFYSDFISGADRLPNGNTLIVSGADGRIFEVTAEKKMVWEYWNPFGGEVPPHFGPPGGPGGAPLPGGPPPPERDAAPPDGHGAPPPDGKTPPPGPGRPGRNPRPISLFRATRLAPDQPGLAGKNLR